jgi:GMP synthase (glutamine-hydrolysing)
MSDDETILVLDFGSQYAQLIARRVREQQVYARIVRPDLPAAELAAARPAGLILSGGPASVYAEGAPRPDPAIFELGVPILGICYGMQVGVQVLGGRIEPHGKREYGRAHVEITDHADLFAGLPDELTVWMSHGDQVADLPDGFTILARTATCPVAALRHDERAFFGTQFHPEVVHTPRGAQILANFLYRVCRCAGTWRMTDFAARSIARIRDRVGGATVVCGLSGGVDSAVVAALIHRAVGDQLVCIFVDNGLLRGGEVEQVVSTFRGHFGLDLRVVDAADRFLDGLAGVTDPQEKRRIIGHEFIAVFEEEARRLPAVKFLAQGTLYPDVIESGASVGGTADVIKLHHNVGGLPAKLGLELIEPLRDLFKDEVRQLGAALGLPEAIIWRHPFPGPGLAVRCVGEVTRERLALLRRADEILLEEIVAANLYRSIGQAFAVLLPVSTVGVMGDGRTYDNVVAIRAVETTDFMTADWVHLPHEVLATVSNRIINEVPGVNRVVYDISSKPPSTIEWE